MSKFNQGNLIPVPDPEKVIKEFYSSIDPKKVSDNFRFLMHFFLIEANGTKEFKDNLVHSFNTLEELIDQISLIEKIRNDERINRN